MDYKIFYFNTNCTICFILNFFLYENCRLCRFMSPSTNNKIIYEQNNVMFSLLKKRKKKKKQNNVNYIFHVVNWQTAKQSPE